MGALSPNMLLLRLLQIARLLLCRCFATLWYATVVKNQTHSLTPWFAYPLGNMAQFPNKARRACFLWKAPCSPLALTGQVNDHFGWQGKSWQQGKRAVLSCLLWLPVTFALVGSCFDYRSKSAEAGATLDLANFCSCSPLPPPASSKIG